MRAASMWGVAATMMVWSGVAAAQMPPKPPAPAPTTPPAPSASAPAPGLAPPTDPAAPPPATEPAPTEAAPPPIPAPESAPAPTADSDEGVTEEPPRKKKKRKKKKVRYEDEQPEYDREDDDREDDDREDDDDGEEEPEIQLRRKPDWRLAGTHFVLSAERLTSVLAWSQKIKAQVPNPEFPSGTIELEAETSGTDVGFLGAGGFDRNPFSIPRLGFDGVFSNGFTLGGSISYLVSSGETTQPDGFSSSSKTELATLSVFVLAPRVGVLIPTSPKLAVWLRGGITRLNLASERPNTTSAGSTSDSSITYWDLTLDPQLVISPVPHVGILVGAAIDIGIGGSIDAPTSGINSSTGSEPELSASSYGVTAGLAAIF